MKDDKRYDNFCKRLQHLIDCKKVSQVELARAIGTTESVVSTWLRKSTGKPQRKNLQALSEYFQCDINWLATGEGDSFRTETKTKEDIADFNKIKAGKDNTNQLALMTRLQFKMNCPGWFAEFFDFIGDNYGEDQESVAQFLTELARTHSNYRVWVEEKKQERDNAASSDPAIKDIGNS